MSPHQRKLAYPEYNLDKKMAAEGSEVALKYTALVVDDMPIIRAVEQVFLSARGFKTEEVENGKEAVDLFTAGKSFDVVLMDMEMPVMNGIQATKEIRAMGVKSLIFGITSADEQSMQTFKAAGLDECFEKPLDDEKIDKILERLNERIK